MKKLLLVTLLLLQLAGVVLGKDVSKDAVIIKLAPDHRDWIYKTGEKVTFIVNATGLPENTRLNYQIGPEKMKPVKSGTIQIKNGVASIDGGTMQVPGFLRCRVSAKFNGKEYNQIATAAFSPEAIKPTIQLPNDFKKFWDGVKKNISKIPLDARLTLIPKRSTSTVEVYQVGYQNDKPGSRFYGVVCIPKKAGKFPAVIRFPGAGLHPLSGNVELAKSDVITLDLYIHEFPVTLERKFYDSLTRTPMLNYKFFGVEERDSFYYKRVISGCLKAVDFIYSLPKFDGKNLAAWGSSQGGFLSIATTSLDNRIRSLVVLCPAMSDISGYLFNRAGGWPHLFNDTNRLKYDIEKVKNAVSYYDVVNFARFLKVPGFYSWGFNDETTPPTSFYSAYNVIKSPRQLLVIPEGRHAIYAEQREKSYQWLLERFGLSMN